MLFITQPITKNMYPSPKVSVGNQRSKSRKRSKKKGRGMPEPPKPDNLPKKPPTGFFLYMETQRSSGAGGNITKMQESWKELGVDGQKQYVDMANERALRYEKEMKEFTKSAEGKRYFRLKAAFEKKSREHKAKERFLGAADAPKEPKRPPSAYFLFVQEKRSTVPPGKIGDVAKLLTEMWGGLAPEERKVYEERVDQLKEQYDKDLAAYKDSAHFKKYDKAVKAIQGKGKAKAKAKSQPAIRSAGGKGPSRGAAAVPARKPVMDSDSDVMGSDSDNSSSSSDDSDSD